MEIWKTKNSLFKGCQPILDECGITTTYHLHLQKLRHELPPTNLNDFGHISIQTTDPSVSRLQKPKDIKRSDK